MICPACHHECPCAELQAAKAAGVDLYRTNNALRKELDETKKELRAALQRIAEIQRPAAEQ